MLGGLAGLALAGRLRRPSFRGQVVLITGGSKGLGLLLARRFAAEGAHLALLARDPEDLAQSALELYRQHGARVLTLACDVRDESAVKRSVARTLGAFGRLDVLVNNAGVIQVGPFENSSNEDFEEALEVNFWGALHAIRATLPALRARRGRIVNIASIGGKVAVPHLAAYSASKFALVGLSDALRAELAKDGIRVTTVCPWLMRTGSHYNVQLKGQHAKELSLFALLDALPGLSMSAERAADQIIEACRRGRARLVLAPQGKAALLASELFPELTASALKLVARLLPGSDPQGGDTARSGWEVRGETPLAPSLLTRLADRAASRNNQTRGRA